MYFSSYTIWRIVQMHKYFERTNQILFTHKKKREVKILFKNFSIWKLIMLVKYILNIYDYF